MKQDKVSFRQLMALLWAGLLGPAAEWLPSMVTERAGPAGWLVPLLALPVLLAALLFGPGAGFAVGAVADIIGGVLAGYAINPLITLGAASIGLVGGLGWRKLSHLRTGNRLWCSVLAAHFVGSMVINSLALHIFYGYAWAVLIARIPNALVLTAVNTVLLRILLENRALMAVAKR